ncbi:hypothetical protein GDO86_001338 [Hymenochirus boettgeri]|uniref:Focadhesin n=1 Tax=Hymenochirus boettgeri TaxID=247094 RepID=A0A8T2KC89_9PIPI|nr:hypothetical protein GDO86_001338 [Hymenochirus boettgeri]
MPTLLEMCFECEDPPIDVVFMEPFLRYLYCEPSQLKEYSALRMGLRKSLLQTPRQSDRPSKAGEYIFHIFFDMMSYLQVSDSTQVTETVIYMKDLCSSLQQHQDFWRTELCLLSLQALCACEISLKVLGDCSLLIEILDQNADLLGESFPAEQVLIGLSLLLLQTPSSQQKRILNLALKILSCRGTSQSPSIAQVLVMPLLQVLSSSAIADCFCDRDGGTSLKQLATSLLEMIQKETHRQERKQMSVPLSLPITTWHCSVVAALNVLDKLKADSTATHDWLSSITSVLLVVKQVPVNISLVLGFLMITESEQGLLNVLTVITEVSKVDPSQVPYIVPALMFRLGHSLAPESSRNILYTLPKLGTHKVCVSQILRVLQMLGNVSNLQPIVLRLMTSLWEKQDRIYPELQKVMAFSASQSIATGKEILWEKMLAKAATVREICRHRPYQHGADMLAAITQVLNECTKPDQSTPAALVLQGLCALCQAEVVDIRSTWNALSPKLSCDTRPLVRTKLHELFALVPSLTVNTEDYQKFKTEIISTLWQNTQSKNPIVATSAYKSLCEFDIDEHTILHLPDQARPEMPPQDEYELAADKEEKEIDLSVPASSYIKLMVLTPSTVLPAFESFLSSLMKQEMDRMPRGIYHTALRGAFRSDQGKTVAGIPSFMLKMYERNKQPGLKPGLAAGMLLCYDLPIQTDKDGRPIDRFLASRGRSYQQMLTALINEVNIQASEWHRSLLLPQSWLGFMTRMFHAVIQGRQAELEMQLKHGKDDPQELQYKTHTAWLWVRDALTDVIRCAVKDSPVVKGNALLALTGLAVAVWKYESSLPSESEGAPEIGPDILPTSAWISMVLDTLLSVVDNHYHPNGRIFTWFQHKSYSGENTASVIARSCAVSALSLLVPVLVVSDKMKVEEILNLFSARLPGKHLADESQSLQIHIGLALGMFLSRLCEEKISDVSGQQLNLQMMRSLDALESSCFDQGLEYNTGCILSVGLVLSSMCQSSQTDNQVHVSATLRKLFKTLCESEDKSRTFQEVLSYAVACVTVSAFSAEIIGPEEAEEHMNKLRTLAEQNQQTPGLALSLGNIVHGLAVCGHGKAEDLNDRLLPAWIKILLAEGCPTMQRLAAINGLVALVGSESSLIQLKSEAIQSSQFQSKLSEVIRTITQIISFSGVIGLQTNAAWILGHLHLSSLSSSQSRTSVPPDFSYLPERSLIRSAVEFIISAGKKGPETLSQHLVKVCLSSIAATANGHQYPPVNWASILAPLMRMNFGEEIQRLCIQIVVTQAQTSQNAAQLLGMWLIPPLVYSLTVKTRSYLLSTLSLWMRHVSEDKLQTFADLFIFPQFEEESKRRDMELSRIILQGLSQAMKLPNPPQHCWSFLCKTSEKLVQVLPNQILTADVDLYVEVAECVSEMADSEVERIFCISKDSLEKAIFMRVYLISKGRLPLSCLDDVIKVASEYREKQSIVWMLVQAFYQARITSHPNTGVLKRMEWFLDFISHIRNVVYQSTVVHNVELSKVVDFLLQVFAASVVAWADHDAPLLIGISGNCVTWSEKEQCSKSIPACLGRRSVDMTTVQLCFTVLPTSMLHLVAKEPWKAQVQKLIDWLINILESPEKALSRTSRSILKATLLSLRGLPEFKRKAVWTKAYGW